jgi:hypothetical protein
VFAPLRSSHSWCCFRRSPSDRPRRSRPSRRHLSNLTSKGRALSEFEALLHDQFGDLPVPAHYRQGCWWNFTACRTGCAPLSYWSIYFFTFTNARNSTFYLSGRGARPNLGNYPMPIKVKGRYVACDRSGSRFLITYGSAAGLAFDCRPSSSRGAKGKG